MIDRLDLYFIAIIVVSAMGLGYILGSADSEYPCTYTETAETGGER